jgi:predicted transcriptional regulator of viral defense system
VPGRAYQVLFDIAADQRGYVTQEQAGEHGFDPTTLVQMARRGQAEHVAQGLYRFKAFPPGPLDTYMEASLWPQGARGVLSHETALDLYGLSDANPDKIHITVPTAYRIKRATPPAYEIHHAELKPDETTWRDGLPLTTVERTIRDCHQTHLRRGLLEQALDQARARGLINATTERKLRKEITEPVAAQGAQ